MSKKHPSGAQHSFIRGKLGIKKWDRFLMLPNNSLACHFAPEIARLRQKNSYF